MRLTRAKTINPRRRASYAACSARRAVLRDTVKRSATAAIKNRHGTAYQPLIGMRLALEIKNTSQIIYAPARCSRAQRWGPSARTAPLNEVAAMAAMNT